MATIHIIYIDIDTGSYPGVNHGLASLNAFLKRNDHSVSLHHICENESEGDVASRAKKSNADIIGFSFTTNQKKYVEKYSIAIYNQMKVPQIAGGIHPTIAPVDTLKIGNITGACIGEGEHSLCELLKCIDNKKDFMGTPGFWWRNSKDTIIRNSIPPLDVNIHSTFPDYSIFDTHRISLDSSGWVSMMLMRGCPYNCYYCCNHVLRTIYPNIKNYLRIPTPERAVEIIKHNMKYYKKVTGINFADDLLIFNEKWFLNFATLYSMNIGLPYTCNGRIEHFTDNILQSLKDSGCKTVYIGVESGNEWIRKNLLNRKHTNDEIIDCIYRIKDHGISVFTFNIVGFPFETKQQMQETYFLNKKAKPNSGVVFYFYPYPATRLFDICREFDLISDKKESLSSYLEKPAIMLSHCTEKDCIKEYNRIRLYLVTQSILSSLKLPGFFSIIFNFIFGICSNFWVKTITQKSPLKSFLRKIYYYYRFK